MIVQIWRHGESSASVSFGNADMRRRPGASGCGRAACCSQQHVHRSGSIVAGVILLPMDGYGPGVKVGATAEPCPSPMRARRSGSRLDRPDGCQPGWSWQRTSCCIRRPWRRQRSKFRYAPHLGHSVASIGFPRADVQVAFQAGPVCLRCIWSVTEDKQPRQRSSSLHERSGGSLAATRSRGQ